MKTQYDVVVIGGGVIGGSVLYHLAKRKLTNVVLLERSLLTSGSSWHAAGGFHTVNSDTNMSYLQHYTSMIYEEIEQISGLSCGLHRCGSLYLASDKKRWQAMLQDASKAKFLGIQLDPISMDEAQKICPILNKDFFVGAMYDAIDGHLDPAGTTRAYVKAAQNLGADVFENTPVTDCQMRSDGTWDVVTKNGVIHTEKIVNAGGLWAREVSALVGHKPPCMPMEHQYIITEDVQSIIESQIEMPMTVDYEGGLYLRQEQNGVLLGTYESEPKHWSKKGTPQNFGHELLEPATFRLEEILYNAFQRFPDLMNAGIKKEVNGPMVFTPDGNPLVGPIRSVPNYYLACGCMAGFVQGGGVGLIASDWIIDGHPSIDIHAMDPARFHKSAFEEDYLLPKTYENYSRRFALAYPNEDLKAAREYFKTPLYEDQKKLGAYFGVSMGLEYPQWYGVPNTEPVEIFGYERSNSFEVVFHECNAIRKHLALMDISIFAKYEIKGDGAEQWLDYLLANQLPKMNRVNLAPMLDERGQLQGDLSIGKLNDKHYYIVGSGAAEQVHMRWFEKHLPQDSSVQLKNLTYEYGALHICGPNSKKFVRKLGIPEIKFRDIIETNLAGVPVWIIRMSFTGEEGYEIHCSYDHIKTVFNFIQEKAQDETYAWAGIRAMMSCRLEKGYGAWLHEFKTDRTPQEAGLASFVQPKKGHFIGKENFLQNGQPKYQLCSFLMHTDIDPVGDEPIWYNDQIEGFVTSGGFGYTVQDTIAMGYLKSDIAQKMDATFLIEILGRKIEARLVQQPLYDPQGLKLKENS